MRTNRRLFVHAALLAVCATVAVAAAPASQTGEPVPPKPRVVVAAIDSAPNPYHGFFHAGGPNYLNQAPDSVTPDVLDEFGIGPEHIIRVTRTGNAAADFQTDKAQFDAIEAGQAYWYEGTNIIGISFNGAGSRLRPNTGSTHGIGVSASVLNANPEAIVVMVEAPGAGLGVGWATTPLGEQWAFNHPAVDFISTSYGPPGSPPVGYHLRDSYDGVVTNGKLHFGASDNSPAAAPVDATAGPWWVVGIAGFGEGSHEGKELQSGTSADFVADWTQNLPYCRNCTGGYTNVSGTSFGTPTSAGVASKILLEARRAAGHLRGIVTAGVTQPLLVDSEDFTLTNWELRRALEEAAYFPTTADWSQGVGHAPVVDAAPWATVGWGAITADPAHDVIGQALGHLGLGDAPTRSKDVAACGFMTAEIAARHVYWDQVARFSDSNGNSADPYLAC